MQERLAATAEEAKDLELSVDERYSVRRNVEHMNPTHTEGTDEVEAINTVPMDGEVSIASGQEVEEISEYSGEPLPDATESEDHEVPQSGEEEEIDVEYVDVEEEGGEEDDDAKSLEESLMSAHSKQSADDESEDGESGSFQNSDSEDSSEDAAADFDDCDDSSFSLTIHGEMDPSSIGSLDPLPFVEKGAATPSVKQVDEEESVYDEGIDEEEVLFEEDEDKVSNVDEQHSTSMVEEEVEVTVRSDSEVCEEDESEITADGERVPDVGKPFEEDNEDGNGVFVDTGPQASNNREEEGQLEKAIEEIQLRNP